MKSRTILIEFIRVVLAVCIVALSIWVFRNMGGGRKPERRDEQARAAELVDTIPAKVNTTGLDFYVDGVATPYREIPVAAEVAGRIVEKSEDCRAGRFVSKGAAVVELDRRDYELEVQRLQKEILQAESSISESLVETQNIQALLALASKDVAIQEREVQRIQDLQQKRAASAADVDKALRSQIVAQNAYTQLLNRERLRKSQHDKLLAALELKKVQLSRAQLDLDRTQVTSPIDGVIVEATAEKDAYVQKGAPLFVVEDTSRVEVRCQLKMSELYWLWSLKKRGASADLETPASSAGDYEIPNVPATVEYSLGGKLYQWEGVLSRFEGIGLDARTRTMPCRVSVTNPRGAKPKDGESGGVAPPALVRGMFVKVRLEIPSDEPLVRVPELAIRPGNKLWVNENGHLKIIPVSVVRIDRRGALLRRTNEVRPDIRVVVSPLVAPRPDMPLRESSLPVETEEESTADGANESNQSNATESKAS